MLVRLYVLDGSPNFVQILSGITKIKPSVLVKAI